MSSPNERPRRVARARVAALVMLLGLALAGPLAPAVSAHAVLEASDPADGAVLPVAPKTVRLTFTGGIAAGLSTFELARSDGRLLAVDVVADPADATSVLVNLRDGLAAGAYRLSWRAVSSGDLHPSSGSIVFGIRVPVSASDLAPAAQPTPVDAPGETGSRWLDLSALAILIGPLAMILALLPGALRSRGSRMDPGLAADIRRRLARLAAIGGIAALLTGLLRLVVQTIDGTPDADPATILRVLASTDFGRSWLARELILGALVALAFRVAARAPGRGDAVAASFLIGGLGLAHASSSHLAVVTQPAGLGIAVGAAHLIAAGIWVGGLVALAVVITPLVRRRGGGAAAGVILRRFGVLAGTSLAALAVTGIFAAGQVVATPDALITSAYGLTLLAKILLVVVVVALGLANALALHPGLRASIVRLSPIGFPARARRGRKPVLVEAAGALAVLLLVGALGSMPPARGADFDPSPEATPATPIADRAADLLVTLAVRPNRPGQNFVSIGVLDTRRPAPAPISAVRLGLVAPDGTSSSVSARRLGDGRYEVAGDELTMSGDWTVTVTVDRPGLTSATLAAPWKVLPVLAASRARPTIVSDQPLAPITTRLAIAGLLIAIAVVLVARVRRTRIPAIRQPIATAPSRVGQDGWPG